jgi:hypothetical protein
VQKRTWHGGVRHGVPAVVHVHALHGSSSHGILRVGPRKGPRGVHGWRHAHRVVGVGACDIGRHVPIFRKLFVRWPAHFLEHVQTHKHVHKPCRQALTNAHACENIQAPIIY